MHLLRPCSVVVPAVAGELLAACRVEGDVQQLRAVAIRPEHVGRDKARAREIAFIAEDAIELEGMSDRFVDLQDHLIGHQQYVHRPARAVRRGNDLERLLRDATPAAHEAEARQDLRATLLTWAAIAV